LEKIKSGDGLIIIAIGVGKELVKIVNICINSQKLS